MSDHRLFFLPKNYPDHLNTARRTRNIMKLPTINYVVTIACLLASMQLSVAFTIFPGMEQSKLNAIHYLQLESIYTNVPLAKSPMHTVQSRKQLLRSAKISMIARDVEMNVVADATSCDIYRRDEVVIFSDKESEEEFTGDDDFSERWTQTLPLANVQSKKELSKTRLLASSKETKRNRAGGKIRDSIKETSAGKPSKKVAHNNVKPISVVDKKTKQTLSSLSQSIIHTAIEDLLRQHSTHDFQSSWDDSALTAAFNSFGKTIGILGESERRKDEVSPSRPGSILLHSTNEDDVIVRLATPSDDVDIANLRLSVFSDFSPDLQSQFCLRSCQAIAARRIRGATCVVATVPRKGVSMNGCQSRMIVGTAECSFHEFIGTQIGRRRPTDSLFYITEVAVNPNARRRGVGTKLLKAIDTLANERGIESLYLHVDVSNHGALKLYHKSGYQKVMSNNSMYMEFTTSLNLHPGATKGRDHFLYCRHLTKNLTWSSNLKASNNRKELLSTLGFEIPA